jgi:hypothetical protein
LGAIKSLKKRIPPSLWDGYSNKNFTQMHEWI